MLVDLRDEEVTGKELERRLDEAHITCNKNTIPNDPRSPFVTSGVDSEHQPLQQEMVEEDMDVIAEGYCTCELRVRDNIEK